MKTIANKRILKLQELIEAQARFSLAILGMSFVRHGSGRFVWLGPATTRKRR